MDQRFTVVPTFVLFANKASLSAKMLYCLLSSYGQNGRGTVWPDQATLAQALGLGVRQVNRLLTELESLGLITRVRTMKSNGHFGRNEYELRGFEVSVEIASQPSDTDVTRQPSDIGDLNHRTLVTESIGHGCPIENKNTEQEQENKNTTTKKKKGFIKPEKEELEAFFASKGADKFSCSRQADLFISFYESKGWMVGKNKMASWKGAAAGWFVRGMDRGDFRLVQKKPDPASQGGLF